MRPPAGAGGESGGAGCSTAWRKFARKPKAATIERATRAIQGFVTAYNTLNTTLVGLTKYDPVSKTGSTLTGDSTVRGIRSGLTAILTRPVAALADSGTTLDTLGQLGVSLQADGTLALDTTKLSAALAGNSNVGPRSGSPL